MVGQVLSEMAVTEPYSFRAVVETVKAKGGSPPPEGRSISLAFDKNAIVDFDDLENDEDGREAHNDDDDVRIVRGVIANDGEEEGEASASSLEADEEDKNITARASTTSSA